MYAIRSYYESLLESVIPTTFNAASVDGDTSTNDTVMLFANRKSGAFDAEAFKEALHGMLRITSYNVCYTKLLRADRLDLIFAGHGRYTG